MLNRASTLSPPPSALSLKWPGFSGS
jgi:hypothetical protein